MLNLTMKLGCYPILVGRKRKMVKLTPGATFFPYPVPFNLRSIGRVAIFNNTNLAK